MSDDVKRPTKAGWYWALWTTAAEGTHEGDQLTPANDWEIVEVWENYLGTACEADDIHAPKWAVSVPGVQQTQWPENFKWGNEVPSRLYVEKLEAECAKQETALDKLARLGNEPNYGNSTGNQIAQDALGVRV